MKKILKIVLIILICTITVYAATKNFTITSSSLSFTNSKKQAIKKEFDQKYNLEYKVSTSDDKLKQEITSLSKKVTYLLLGEIGTSKETSEEYYNRHKEYLAMRYAPKIPTNEKNELDAHILRYAAGNALCGIFSRCGRVARNIGGIEAVLPKGDVVEMPSLRRGCDALALER